MKPQPWHNYQSLVCVGVPVQTKLESRAAISDLLLQKRARLNMAVSRTSAGYCKRYRACTCTHKHRFQRFLAQRRKEEMTGWVRGSGHQCDGRQNCARREGTQGDQSRLDWKEAEQCVFASDQEVTFTMFQLIQADSQVWRCHVSNKPHSSSPQGTNPRTGLFWDLALSNTFFYFFFRVRYTLHLF